MMTTVVVVVVVVVIIIIIIIIMVILSAISPEITWPFHIKYGVNMELGKNQQIKSTAHDRKSYLK